MSHFATTVALKKNALLIWLGILCLLGLFSLGSSSCTNALIYPPNGLDTISVGTNDAAFLWNTGVADSQAQINRYHFHYTPGNMPPTDWAYSILAPDTTAHLFRFNPNTVYTARIASWGNIILLNIPATMTTAYSEDTIIFKTRACAPSSLPYIPPIASTPLMGIPSCMSINLDTISIYNWQVENVSPSFGFTGPCLTTHHHEVGDGALDDWLFTNQFALTAGDTCIVSFKYGNNSLTKKEKMEVAFGNNNNASAMTSFFTDTTISWNATKDTVIRFVAPTTDNYYVVVP